MKINSSFILILDFLLIFISTQIYPQEIDITQYLKKIEAGQKEEVISLMPGLRQKYPQSASVIYLDGLLTEDGEKASKIYQTVIDKHPNSKYADDAMYRIYAYFKAIDESAKAELFLKRLKIEYPESPYIHLTQKVSFAEEDKVKQKNETQKKPPKLKESSVDGKAKFTIQAGAFARKENALSLKSDFDKAGYTAQVKEKSVGGSLFHVVFVGNFSTDEEAKSFLSMVNSKFKLQGWIVKLD